MTWGFFLYTIMGTLAALVQFLIFQELYTTFHADAFTAGVTLALWLTGQILGIAASRWSKKQISPSNSFFMVSLTIFLTWLGFRLIQMNFAPSWQPLENTLLYMAAFMLPLASLFGFIFASWTKYLRHTNDGWSGDAMGMILGGMILFLFNFMPLPRVFIFGTIFWIGLGLATLFSGFLTFKRWLFFLGSALCVSFGLFWISAQWTQPARQVKKIDSPYGTLEIMKASNELLIRENRWPLFQWPDPVAEEEVAMTLLAQPESTSTLIIHAAQLLPHWPRTKGETTLFLVNNPALQALLDNLFSRRYPFLEIHGNDSWRFLKKAKNTYDLIVIGQEHPNLLPDHRLLTQEFLNLSLSKLSSNGVLVMILPIEEGYISYPLRRILASVLQTVRSLKTNWTMVRGTNLYIYLFNDSPITDLTGNLTQLPASVQASAAYEVMPRFLDPTTYPILLRQLSLAAPINRLHSPDTYAWSLAHQAMQNGSRWYPIFLFLNQHKIWLIALFIILLFLRLPRFPDLDRSLGMIKWSFLLTGIFIMHSYRYQLYVNLLYHHYIWLSTLFLAGFILGIRGLKNKIKDGIFLQLILVVSIPFWFPERISLWISLFVLGVMLGWGMNRLGTNERSPLSLLAYVMDNLGAILACLLLPLFVIPVFGLFPASLFFVVATGFLFIAQLR